MLTLSCNLINLLKINKISTPKHARETLATTDSLDNIIVKRLFYFQIYNLAKLYLV